MPPDPLALAMQAAAQGMLIGAAICAPIVVIGAVLVIWELIRIGCDARD